ncbi:MAG: hypothetical protein M3220_05780 [Chloroflexota bacterium]|nr:hypothetical protein [Chloroflexota bacterium]
MSDAEIITIGLVAALYYQGNYALACCFLHEQNCIPYHLGKSRFSRRLHRVKAHCLTLFQVSCESWKALTEKSLYAVDTFPVAECEYYRIPRAKLDQDDAYRSLSG